jgi:hypothetical protein
MFKATVIGTVAGNSSRPKKTTRDDGSTWARFSIWTEDQSKPKGEDGKYPTVLISISLPPGEKIFDYLEPGRRVLITGNLSHRPAVGKKKGGNSSDVQAYANPQIYADFGGVRFLDSSFEQLVARVLGFLRTHEQISEEQEVALKAFNMTYFSEENYLDEERGETHETHPHKRQAPRLYETKKEEAPPEDTGF